MKDAHDRAYEILVSHREQMDLMASVLLERETVEGEACLALLDNTWDDYLKHEGEINARKEAEEQAARERDAKLADPNWKEEPVEPGDQNPNPPFREPSDEDDGAAAGAQASGTAPAEPADGSKSFLDEMEKGFREMMGDGKGAPQDGKPPTAPMTLKATESVNDLALLISVRHQDAHRHGHSERYPRFLL